MKIRWVNHASFVLEVGTLKILFDPWLDGTVFDNGWGLVSSTQFGIDDYREITHIWFSHEHPDHFHPPTLKNIPADIRAQISVLYQETLDHKVVEYCRKLGFKDVTELPSGRWHIMPETTGVEVLCQPYTFHDSWLAVRHEGQTVLNLNDCVVTHRAEASRIGDQVGAVDVLLTQFSYAAWKGNQDDDELRRQSAQAKLDRIKQQAEALQPQFIIPFASFVWFCHEENVFQNRGINTIDRVERYIGKETWATPVVLYPNDVWRVGDSHNSQPAITQYMADLDLALSSPLVRSEPSSFQALVELTDVFFTRLRVKNGRLFDVLWRIRVLRVAKIWLTDLEIAVELSPKGLRLSQAPGVFDIKLSSAALAYCLRFEWGGDTLSVNGRFEIPAGGTHQNFRRYFAIASLNNEGQTFISGYAPIVGSKIKRRLDNLSLPRTLNWRQHAAGALMPLFLKGDIDPLLNGRITDWVRRYVYVSRFSQWLKEHPLKPNFDTRYALYAHLADVEGLNAEITYLEFGVATGRSIKWWVEQINHAKAQFHGFDTFTGLPEDWGFIPQGTFSTKGATPQIDDDRVEFHVGLFQDTLPNFLDGRCDKRLVVHLDADLYSSTLCVLTSLAPHLQPGDVLIFDEFARMTDATHEFRAFDDFISAFGQDYVLLGAACGYRQVAIGIR